MTFASQVLASPTIRLPHVTLPKLQWPGLSPGVRALLMMGLMISPAFVADYIGYGIERLFLSSAQITAMQAPDEKLPANIAVFHVACTDPTASAAQQREWSALAARNGWPKYPVAGDTCFRPDRVLLGVVGLKTFNVACPTAVLSVADRQRWANYAAAHNWAAYPQAGANCVDP